MCRGSDRATPRNASVFVMPHELGNPVDHAVWELSETQSRFKIILHPQLSNHGGDRCTQPREAMLFPLNHNWFSKQEGSDIL